MALIKVQTADGERSVRVCDYCKCVCIPSGRFCSGHCARNHTEMAAMKNPTEAIDPYNDIVADSDTGGK